VFAGDLLVSPPMFRSTVTLSSGVTLELLGRTAVTMLPAGPSGVPGVQLKHGRLVILTPGKADSQLRLETPGRASLITFGDSGSTFAVEARPLREEGTDPEAQASAWALDVFVSSGMIVWSDAAGGTPIAIEAPASRILAAGASTPVISDAQLPTWIGGEQPALINRQAAEFIYDYLAREQPTELLLHELTEHNRSEVKTLAAQILASIDVFEPLVDALNQSDANQRAAWEWFVDDLLAAVARDPATASLVRQAYEKRRGDNAGPLYRMLWGYSTADVRSGALTKLVEYLDHSDMDFRALAFWNLKQISSGQTHNYNPSRTAEQRKRAVQIWKQRLASGTISPKAPGAD
jgi:hypothetical protein